MDYIKIILLCVVYKVITAVNSKREITCTTTAQNLPSDVTKMTFICPMTCDDVTNADYVTASSFYPDYSPICSNAKKAGILQKTNETSIILLPALPFLNQSQVSKRSYMLQDSVCYVNKGENFVDISETTRTITGKECITKQDNDKPCRNAKGVRDRPWCDLYEGGWQYCDLAPSCGDIHVIRLKSSMEFNSADTNRHGNRQTNQHIVWIIVSEEGNHITLTIREAKFTKSDECKISNDQIIIYHNFGKDIVDSKATCDSSNKLSITSSQNLLYVIFRTSDVTDYFKADIQVIAKHKACGQNFNNVSSGSFHSPNYPDFYPNLAICEWKIKVFEGNVININIKSFELKAHSGGNCIDGDYVVINDGGEQLVELCGVLHDEVIISTTNYVTIKFVSDSQQQSRGFSATFQEIGKADCNFENFGENGHFETPGYPEPVTKIVKTKEKILKCYWRISYETNYNITITFSDVIFGNSTVLEIYDGSDESGKIISTLRRGSNFTNITSSTETVLVKLMTSSNTDDVTSLRFHSTANRLAYNLTTIGMATDDVSTQTDETQRRTTDHVKIITTRFTDTTTISDVTQRKESTLSDKSQTTISLDVKRTTQQLSSTKYQRFLSSTDKSTTIILSTNTREDIDKALKIVVPVLCIILLILIATAILLWKVLKPRRRKPRRNQHNVTEETYASRTDELELSSLKTQENA